VAIFRNREEDLKEIGFGTNVYEADQRLVNKDGSSNVQRNGLPFFESLSFYHALIKMSWWKFNVLVFSVYLAVNIVFAFIYYFIGLEQIGGMVASTQEEKFWEAFFFSTQSLTTVGYGRLNPLGMGASIVAAVESMMGLLGFALATGLLYGRFSRPVAKILYSNRALIAPYRGMTGFMIRMANKRKNELIELEATLTMSHVEIVGGKEVRKFEFLNLELKRISILTTTWTIVHPIDDSSPLKGLKPHDFKKKKVEFMLFIKAFDDSFSQTVYSRSSYTFAEIEYGAKFMPLVSPGSKGSVIVSLDKIHDFEMAVVDPVS
jgi:inward rectifier potassium channel